MSTRTDLLNEMASAKQAGVSEEILEMRGRVFEEWASKQYGVSAVLIREADGWNAASLGDEAKEDIDRITLSELRTIIMARKAYFRSSAGWRSEWELRDGTAE